MGKVEELAKKLIEACNEEVSHDKINFVLWAVEAEPFIQDEVNELIKSL